MRAVTSVDGNGGRVTRLPLGDRDALDDLPLEREILGSCLVRPNFLLDADLEDEDFAGDAHRIIWRAMLKLWADDGALDTNRLRGALQDHGLLARVGGEDYLYDLTDKVIPVPPLPTGRLRRLTAQRKLRAAAQRLVLHLSDDAARARCLREMDEARECLRILDEGAAAPPHRLDAYWKTVGEHGSLSKRPLPRKWLLQRIDEQTNGMAAPLGVLPLGKVGLLVAEGGAGKTLALIQLGISVVTGRKWLDHFLIGHTGKVLLALAEEEQEDIDRRLYDVADALRLTDAQRRLVQDNLVTLGLAGESTALISQDGRNTVETDVLSYLRQRLSGSSWSLVVLDTLARFAGSDAEKDSAQATRFIQVAESLCKVPGKPTVLIAHHTNKTSREQGAAVSAGNARGSSALTDSSRWVCNLQPLGDDGARLSITKSNYALRGSTLTLLRNQSYGGYLYAEPADAARQRAQEAQAEAQGRWVKIRGRIFEVLADGTSFRTGTLLAAACGGRKQEVLAVLRDLVDAGEVFKSGGVYRLKTGAPNDLA